MMRYVVLFLAAFLLVAQEGDPDDPNPEWPGQKASCTNFKTDHPCACFRTTHCKKPGDGDMGGNGDAAVRCKTWCRADHCKCATPCDTTELRVPKGGLSHGSFDILKEERIAQFLVRVSRRAGVPN